MSGRDFTAQDAAQLTTLWEERQSKLKKKSSLVKVLKNFFDPKRVAPTRIAGQYLITFEGKEFNKIQKLIEKESNAA